MWMVVVLRVLVWFIVGSQCNGGPGSPSAPGISGIISSDTFNQMLKHRNDSACPARGFFTYDTFIQAAKSFPAFGTTGDVATRKREIAAFLGQTSHETTGGWTSAPDGPYSWGYCFNKEQNPTNYCDPSPQYPCASGEQYYGRGPFQLSCPEVILLCNLVISISPSSLFSHKLWFLQDCNLFLDKLLPSLFLGGGQQIPMIDTAVAFAYHGGANSIIITTLSNSLHFHKNVRHQQSGLPITVLTWPRIVKASDINMFAGPTTDTSVLQQHLRQLLEDLHPDAIVVEIFHGWAADVLDELKSEGSSSTAVGVSSRCVFHNVTHYAPHQKLGSDSEPFELTRSQFPPFIRDLSQGGFDWRKKAM